RLVVFLDRPGRRERNETAQNGDKHELIRCGAQVARAAVRRTSERCGCKALALLLTPPAGIPPSARGPPVRQATIPEFDLWTGSSVLDASLRLATHEDHEVCPVARLGA